MTRISYRYAIFEGAEKWRWIDEPKNGLYLFVFRDYCHLNVNNKISTLTIGEKSAIYKLILSLIQKNERIDSSGLDNIIYSCDRELILYDSNEKKITIKAFVHYTSFFMTDNCIAFSVFSKSSIYSFFHELYFTNKAE